MSKLLDALLPDADFPVQHLKQLIGEARKEGKHQLITALGEYKDKFVHTREQSELSIYDAAAAGDPAKLLKELDAKLGIPPLDNSLSGVGWFFNALHRWMAELFAAGAAKTLVNQPMGNVPLLHAAVASGNTETVRLLLERGADMSALDRHDHNALSKAKAEEQHSGEIVNLLMERHAPDRRLGSGGVAVPTQAANGRSTTAATAADEAKINGPSKDAAKSFKKLLAEATSVLPQPQDLARELNGNTPMSVAQAELFTVGYMADFQPPQASDDGKRRPKRLPQSSDAVHQLQLHSESFRAEGRRLEASKETDIQHMLDRLTWALFDELLTIPNHVEKSAQAAGLCKLLIAVVEQALANARKNEDWSLPSNERRKKIFSGCLRDELSQFSKTRTNMNGQDTKQKIYEQLLNRQIALLENYCKAVDDAPTPHAGKATDFSEYIW